MRAVEPINRLAAVALQQANEPRNAAKGDWPTSQLHLFWLLLVEVAELAGALLVVWWWSMRLAREQRPGSHPDARVLCTCKLQKARRHAEHEAGDCCNFLAFIISRL